MSAALARIKALKESAVGQKRQHQQDQEHDQERRQQRRRQQPQQHSALPGNMVQLAEKELSEQASSVVPCIDWSSGHLL
jgi:hypothetical protein